MGRMMSAPADLSERDAPAAVPCARCGYDVRALTEPRCPECGLAFDPHAQPLADVPWFRREQIGAVRAYYRTVWLVLSRPRRLAEQVGRDVEVDARGAAAFRRVTIWLASLSIATATFLMAAFDGGGFLGRMPAIAFIVALAGALLFFHVTTWIDHNLAGPTLFARDRFARLQNFCCAALGLAPVLPLLVLLGRAPAARGLILPGVTYAALPLAALAILAAWWASDVLFHRRAGRASLSAATIHAATIPLFWLVAAFAALAVMWPLTVVASMLAG